jgi:flagellar motor switch protein FliN/FliY
VSGIPAFEVFDAVARALEVLLGHGVILTVGDASPAHPDESVLPEGDTRTVALPFAGSVMGEITLVLSTAFAASMEAAVHDGSLLSATIPPLQAGAAAAGIATTVEHAGEISTDTLLMGLEGDFIVIPLYENDDIVACLVIRALQDAQMAAPPMTPTTVLPAAEVARTPSTSPPDIGTAVALHEFQPLGDNSSGAGSVRSLTLLNDVSMEVTAELGRMHMRMRDLMALAPGSVIELDRAAGSPVDVLMNGAIIAHGEVVVIDEEFGIRVSEIVVGDN